MAHPMKWTREDIICAIQMWAEENGKPPWSNDWKKTGGDWPNNSTVATRFGSWNKAIKAAGFEPSTNNERKFSRAKVFRLHEEGLSNNEIAEVIGVHPTTIAKVIGTTPRVRAP